MSVIYVGDLAGSPPPAIPYGRYLLDVGALPRPGHVQVGWKTPTVTPAVKNSVVGLSAKTSTVVANSKHAIVGAGYRYPTVIAAAEE
jgi:hypothetical protein